MFSFHILIMELIKEWILHCIYPMWEKQYLETFFEKIFFHFYLLVSNFYIKIERIKWNNLRIYSNWFWHSRTSITRSRQSHGGCSYPHIHEFIAFLTILFRKLISTTHARWFKWKIHHMNNIFMWWFVQNSGGAKTLAQGRVLFKIGRSIGEKEKCST